MRFLGSSSVATSGMPGISGSLADMRLMVSEPVSPAPTISVRGRADCGARLRPKRCLWLWCTRNTMRDAPSNSTCNTNAVKYTRMGRRSMPIHPDRTNCSTPPKKVAMATANMICMASLTEAYSHRLLYRWNTLKTTTLTTASKPMPNSTFESVKTS